MNICYAVTHSRYCLLTSWDITYVSNHPIYSLYLMFNFRQRPSMNWNITNWGGMPTASTTVMPMMASGPSPCPLIRLWKTEGDCSYLVTLEPNNYHKRLMILTLKVLRYEYITWYCNKIYLYKYFPDNHQNAYKLLKQSYMYMYDTVCDKILHFTSLEIHVYLYSNLKYWVLLIKATEVVAASQCHILQ